MKRLTLMMLALAACEGKGDPRVCGSLAMKLPPSVTLQGNETQARTACVERWAARLSAGKESPQTIASAVVANCAAGIEHAETVLMRSQDMEPDYPAARKRAYGDALFRAVQWRAGGCPIPD